MRHLFLVLTITCVGIAGFSQNFVQPVSNLQAQIPGSDSLTTVAAGAQFKASGWKRLWWGAHYRKEWTTPVTFPVLHLNEIHGGLSALKLGGGHQTKSLRLLSRDGKEYVLRSIDKNLNQLVPNELKGTYINDLLNDQISTSHPYGPVAITKLAESISILHTTPTIYYVPDDAALGEFRQEFANTLCLLEERPSGRGWEHTTVTHQADEMVNSEKLMERIVTNTRNRVDQDEYLKVRLFDMMINDWDRHEDQFIWAVHNKGDKRVYEVFARDRDQAFSKTDGINLYFLSRPWAVRSLQNMDKTVKDVVGHNMAARFMDRQFLNELNKADWLRAVQAIQSGVTDEVIQSAIGEMPSNINEISGNHIINRLQQRRNNMQKYAGRYYRILNKEVTIVGSEKAERFIIENVTDKEISVTGINASQDTFFVRVFRRSETKRIQVYGLQGNDAFDFKGEAKNKFRVRVIGGDGLNTFNNDKRNAAGKRIHIYDSTTQPTLREKPFHLYHSTDSLKTVYNRKAFKDDWWMPQVLPAYNPDDGVILGLGIVYKKQTWGKSPYAWQQRFSVEYATSTGALGFGYKGIFKHTFNKWDFLLSGYYKGPQYVLNFYGYGNNSILTTYDKSYYRARSKSIFINPGAGRTIGHSTFEFGPQFESVEIVDSKDRYITSPKASLDTSVFDRNSFGGANAKWIFSTVGNERIPTKGVVIETGLSYLHNFTQSSNNLVRVQSSAALYFPLSGRLSFAHRTGVATNAGQYEFYQANTVGGINSLRGYWRDRYAGRTSFYQNTELRFKAATIKGYLLRGQLGFFAFVDDGRVWVKDEQSNTIHVGYGGGCYFIPYNRLAFTISYGSSNESGALYLKTGLFF